MRCVHKPNNADKLMLETKRLPSEQIEKGLLNARVFYVYSTALPLPMGH